MIDAVSDATSERALFQAVADWLPRAMGVSRASLARERDGGLHLTTFSGGRIYRPGTVLPLDDRGVAAQAIARRGAILIGDLATHGREIHKPLVKAGFRSLALAPLMTGDACLGTLHALHEEPDFFEEIDGIRLSCIARWIASKLKVLEQLEEIRLLSQTDMLTGASNRRAFMERAADLHWAYQSSGEPFTLLMIDLDHFKAVNDTYGHAAGDVVLTEFSALFRAAIRKRDLLARLGGEEFGVLLDDCTARAAQVVAERIRQEAEAREIAFGGQRLRVTLSMGLAEVLPEDGGLDTLMSRADAALYEAKKTGRNRVICAA
ncbi:GGDEF domain-containing protein [Tropicibacter sp. S64]|uniref:GGDEF domain-containing protein n=1 Tax=Tropicibacter sp. S64 TaxID=3415122 RepID=UPI003C7BFC16